MGQEEKDNLKNGLQEKEKYERDIAENVTAEDETWQKEGRRNKKAGKPKKGSHAMRRILCFLQHICLVVLVIAICIVIGGSTVRVDYFQRSSNYNLYEFRNQEGSYEDSQMFNTIFGYALSDIVRYGVVSGQLETGGSFDGSKIIDVTAYNYRTGDLPEQYVTAEYYLEDLLKWAKHGYEWSSQTMTTSQARNFLADKTRVTIVDPDSKYYNTSDAGYLKSDLGSYTKVRDVSANMLWVDTDNYDGFVDGYQQNNVTITYSDTGETTSELSEKQDEYEIVVSQENEVYYSDGEDEDIGSYTIFVNRYKTIEDKNIEEYVSDWDIYYDLCHNVQNAANGLAYNYAEYLESRMYYSPENSNVRYMIMKTVGDDTQIYTNLTDAQDYMKVSEAMILGTAAGDLLNRNGDRYIYYSPADMVYRTDTTITEDTVRQIFQGYDYAYPETIKIWFSVDTLYPVNDAFRQGYDGYSRYVPYLWLGVAAAIAAGVLYVLIWFYLTCVTGKDVDEDGKTFIRLTSFDDIPTEIAILLAGGVIILLVWTWVVAVELANINPYSGTIISLSEAVVDEQWPGIVLAVVVFAADFFAMLFYYSLIRRIKARTLWKNSYLRRALMRVIGFAWKVYDNGDIVIRTWIPYGAFLLFNVVMLLFAFVVNDGLDDFVGIITLFVMAAVDILVGNLLYRNTKEQQEIVKGIETIAEGQLDYQVETENLHGDNLTLANSVNSIGKGIKEAVEISMKDERMKADLITNVSHDIKTPLTSIINYVDLIKREQVDDEKIKNYINVLDEKSQRLKQLTDDLVEASKISSGNISLSFEKINLTELMNQTIGEFSEKFEQKRLTTVMNINVQNAMIEADSRRIWRVIENLFNNIFKYAMEGTRVYLVIDSLPEKPGYIALSVKNISAMPLNCDPDELTERFIRGDESRTTEGSGLGLSIAKNLTEVQKGTFEIQLDGDLFKVILTFPLADA